MLIMEFPFLDKPGTLFKDRYVTRAKELLHSWQGEDVTQFGIIGVPLSKSSISHSGASFAPDRIRQVLSSFTTYAVERDIDLAELLVWDFGNITMHVTDIFESQRRILNTLTALFSRYPDFIPIILGGDHSISAASIEAFVQGRGKTGIIQFDAHHDLRNIVDGGPSNGTPFRQLIEKGVIAGENLVQIGIRNFSNAKAYSDYAKEKGIMIYTMEDIAIRGIAPIINESLQHLAASDNIYISLDIDVLDQAFAPACPAIGPGGMDTNSLVTALKLLAKNQKVRALDIVEFDPNLDYRDMTSRVAAYIILNFLLEKYILIDRAK